MRCLTNGFPSPIWGRLIGNSKHKGGVRQLAKKLGWGHGREFYETVLYGSLKLQSPHEQNTRMYLGCDDGVKVYLNEDVVFQKHTSDGLIQEYQTFFPVTLKKGENTVFVILDDRNYFKWAAFFGFATDAIYTLPGKELLADVNKDGIVNVLDLVLISNALFSVTAIVKTFSLSTTRKTMATGM